MGPKRNSFVIPVARVGARTAIRTHRPAEHRNDAGYGLPACGFQPRRAMTSTE
jgi:hypothetical protein